MLMYVFLLSTALIVDIVLLSKQMLGIASAMKATSMGTTNRYKKHSPVNGLVRIAVAEVTW